VLTTIRPRKPRIPHCASAFHFTHCLCNHLRMVHEEEKGPCLERGCICLSFRIKTGQLDVKHEVKR